MKAGVLPSVGENLSVLISRAGFMAKFLSPSVMRRRLCAERLDKSILT
jgi:hypothetical protein